MHRHLLLSSVLLAGCAAHRSVPQAAPLTAEDAPVPEVAQILEVPPCQAAGMQVGEAGEDEAAVPDCGGEPASEEEAAESPRGTTRVASATPAETGADEEIETLEPEAVGVPGIHYTADLDDAALEQAWEQDRDSLGSLSVGFAHQGRLINGVQFPDGEGYVVVRPAAAWATQETVEAVQAAIAKVRQQFPDAHPLRVNQISGPEGGWLRPHRSHQSGRDVDLAFYYPTPDPIRVRARESVIDVEKTYALVEALITETDVQLILVDRRVIRVLHDHAKTLERDPEWLASIFSGPNALVRHARGHRDHLHVRFYNPRAQELGRRVVPLLAKSAESHVIVHRVRSGDTLGHIALRYGTTVRALQKENGMRGTFLKLGQRLRVRLRGPCTQCPTPPPMVVPPRRLPPGSEPVAMRCPVDLAS
ncbi:MAG TPA: penicillin-insensitive murein endopeptidase [Myxococcaceae bacterium]|nr:penicillin-insensitive murein endopeptidase [Myxococcaceae bacterium]